jgi:hypothetical protein
MTLPHGAIALAMESTFSAIILDALLGFRI